MFHQHKLMPALAAVIFTAILSACQPSAQEQQQPPQQQKPAVSVVELAEQSVTLKTELPARAVAVRRAEVRPQINGIIDKRLFSEGAMVEAGEQLYQIQPEIYDADLQTAKASLKRAQANLTTTEARETRYRELLDDNAISQQEYDDALAAYEQAQAEVAVSKSEVAMAEINLKYTRVNAPIAGRIGQSYFTEGALVSAQQEATMATIHQLDPIYVDIPQAAKILLNLRRQVMEGKLSEDDNPEVRLKLEDGSEYPLSGRLQFTEVDVNENTGSVVMRAEFDNPEGMLLPGMYVRAEIIEGRKDDALLVPQKAVTFDREGNATLFLVNGDNQVEQRKLSVSRAIGQNWLLENGLEAGDRVVVEGLQNIGDGDSVQIDEDSSRQQDGDA